MAAPVVTVIQNIPQKRCAILVSATIGDTITVWRTSASGTAEVRGAVDIVTTTGETGFFDYELPQNTPVSYYATGDDGQGATELAGEFDFGGDVIFDLAVPSAGMVITVESYPQTELSISRDVVDVWDRSDPVVVSGERRLPSGILTLVTLDLSERTELLATLATGNIIAFSPRYPEYGMSSPSYFAVGTVMEIRPSRLAVEPVRRWTLEVQEVLAPRSSYVYPVGTRTWQDILDDYADWDAVADTYWYDIAGL